MNIGKLLSLIQDLPKETEIDVVVLGSLRMKEPLHLVGINADVNLAVQFICYPNDEC